MSRPKNSRNKATQEPVIASHLSTQERLRVLANMIIDSIIRDQNNGKALYKKLMEKML